MRAKAFTLIELVMVIVILGIIALIAVPTVNTIIKDSKAKAYDEQVALITGSAKTYMSKNSMELPNQNDGATVCLTIEKLQTEGFLSDEDIKNPNYKAGSTEETRKNEFFNGTVKVTYEVAADTGKGKYKYTYLNSPSSCTPKN